MTPGGSGGADEPRRLERVWAGEFGDAYTERNREAAAPRGAFWSELLARHPARRVLEVGCNLGANLHWVRRLVPEGGAWGVDINLGALRRLVAAQPDVRAACARARQLPFADRAFDLVFTAGVLIHQPEESLGDVMREVARCARRRVLCLEYFAPESVEVPYRGQSGALFKRDYGGIYARAVPGLTLLERGELRREQGWDDVTWWLFQVPGAG